MIIKTIYFLGISLSIGAFSFFYLFPAHREMKKRWEVAKRDREIPERNRIEELEAQRIEEKLKKEAERIKEEGMRNLQKFDHKVDPILKSLLLAQLELDSIFDLSTKQGRSYLTDGEIKLLRKWRLDHQKVMDFYVYESGNEALQNLEDSIFYNEKLLEETLRLVDNGGSVDQSFMEYADEKLGIFREVILEGSIDGRGLLLERSNCRYEYLYDRLNRILRRFPTTDAG